MKENLRLYPEYDGIKRDYTYSVYVSQNGERHEIPVYSDIRHANHYSSRSMHAEKDKRFCEFCFEGRVTVEIEVHRSFNSYVVAPSSKKLENSIIENVISVKLEKNGQFAVRLDNDDDSWLCVFADSIENDMPKKDAHGVKVFEAGAYDAIDGADYPAGTLFFFEKGWYDVPSVLLKTGQQVYIAAGAVLNSRITVDECQQNVKIFGRGILRDYNDTRAYNSKTKFNYLLTIGNSWNSENITRGVVVKDIKLLDATSFNVVFIGAQDCDIQGIKIISGEISTDGFSFWGTSQHIRVSNCFAYVTDNMFVMGAGGMCDDIHFKDMLVATSIKLFFPQALMGYNNTFENIDVFRATRFYEAVGGYQGALNVKNITAVDCTDTLLFNTSPKMKGTPNRIFNVTDASLPDTPQSRKMTILNALGDGEESGGHQVNFKNFYFGGREITELSTEEGTENIFLSDKSTDGAKISLEYDGTYTPVKVCGQIANYTAIKLFVNKRPVEARLFPVEENGTVYIDAQTVAEIYGFDTSFDGETLTIKDDSVQITVSENEAVVNGKKTAIKSLKSEKGIRVPYDFFNKTLGLGAVYDENTKTVRLENLFRDKNLLVDYDFEDIHSLRSWTTRNFTYNTLTEDEKHSGKRSMLYGGDTSFSLGKGQYGTYQYVLDQILQYGAGTYRATFWAKTNDEDTQGKIIGAGVSYHYDSNVSDEELQPLTNEWKKYTYDITVPEEYIDIAKKFAMSIVYMNADTVYVDDVDFRKLK